MNNQSPNSVIKLKLLVDAVSHDHTLALQSLGITRLLAAARVNTNIVDQSDFIRAVSLCAEESFILAIWRMFDSDPKCAGILGVCRYAQENPSEFKWLNSKKARVEFPDPRGEVMRLTQYWLEWREKQEITSSIALIRNQFVGHRGLKPTLGKFKDAEISWANVWDALQGTNRFVNEFSRLISDSSVHHDHIYEIVAQNGAYALSCSELFHQSCLKSPEMARALDELQSSILREEADSRAKDGWRLS